MSYYGYYPHGAYPGYHAQPGQNWTPAPPGSAPPSTGKKPFKISLKVSRIGAAIQFNTFPTSQMVSSIVLRTLLSLGLRLGATWLQRSTCDVQSCCRGRIQSLCNAFNGTTTRLPRLSPYGSTATLGNTPSEEWIQDSSLGPATRGDTSDEGGATTWGNNATSYPVNASNDDASLCTDDVLSSVPLPSTIYDGADGGSSVRDDAKGCQEQRTEQQNSVGLKCEDARECVDARGWASARQKWTTVAKKCDDSTEETTSIRQSRNTNACRWVSCSWLNSSYWLCSCSSSLVRVVFELNPDSVLSRSILVVLFLTLDTSAHPVFKFWVFSWFCFYILSCMMILFLHWFILVPQFFDIL